MTNDPMTKKYILKPGKHQFAPGSHATHHNDNLTDAEAEWYLERYPHIATLFEAIPFPQVKSVKSPKIKSVKPSSQKPVKSKKNEDLPATN